MTPRRGKRYNARPGNSVLQREARAKATAAATAARKLRDNMGNTASNTSPPPPPSNDSPAPSPTASAETPLTSRKTTTASTPAVKPDKPASKSAKSAPLERNTAGKASATSSSMPRPASKSSRGRPRRARSSPAPSTTRRSTRSRTTTCTTGRMGAGGGEDTTDNYFSTRTSASSPVVTEKDADDEDRTLANSCGGKPVDYDEYCRAWQIDTASTVTMRAEMQKKLEGREFELFEKDDGRAEVVNGFVHGSVLVVSVHDDTESRVARAALGIYVQYAHTETYDGIMLSIQYASRREAASFCCTTVRGRGGRPLRARWPRAGGSRAFTVRSTTLFVLGTPPTVTRSDEMMELMLKPLASLLSSYRFEGEGIRMVFNDVDGAKKARALFDGHDIQGARIRVEEM